MFAVAHVFSNFLRISFLILLLILPNYVAYDAKSAALHCPPS